MKFIFLISAILCSNILLGQDSTNYESNRVDSLFWMDSPFVIHRSNPRRIMSNICARTSGNSHSSCIYFYTPSEKIKAKGKRNLQDNKIGKWTYFYENGKRCGTAYFSKKGNKKGVWKYYKINGSLDKVIQVKKDEFGILHQQGKLGQVEVPIYKVMEPLSLE
jgi:hypothetical protein